MARRRRRRFRGLGAIGPRDVKSVAIATVAGGVGVAASTAIVRRVMQLGPLASVPMWGRALVEIALGGLGFFVVKMIDEDAAKGWAGGVAGFGLASLVMGLLDQPVNLGGRLGLRGIRGLRGLRGAAIDEFRPGQPRLAPAQRMSPVAGMGASVISERRVPPFLA